MLSRQIASRLRGYETPFYLYDTALLRQTLESVVYESNKYGYKVHYAIKANYDDHLLAIIREYGLGIDCASGNELRKAVEAGFAPEGIVYAGVGKRDKELRYAIEQGIMAINCESIGELEVVDALSAEAGRVTDVALRINPDIDPKTNHCIDTGQGRQQVRHLLRGGARACRRDQVACPHQHCGHPPPHRLADSRAARLREHVQQGERHRREPRAAGLHVPFRRWGGGLGVNYDVPENEPIPNFASLFSIVHNHLRVGGKEVHFEFGRSIVAECGELITTVLFNKTTATGRKLVIVDASMTELIRPALYGSSTTSRTSRPTRRPRATSITVVGTACESTDVFDQNVPAPHAARRPADDQSAGAYGMSMASRYNLHDLPGAVYSDEIR